MPYIEIGPYYGRDYANQAAVKEDWKRTDRDWKVNEAGDLPGVHYGMACSRADLADLQKEIGQPLHVIVRYAKDQKLVEVKL